MGQSTSSNRVTAQDRAILDMKVQRDKLKAYKKRIQVVLDREHEIARECLRNGQKDKALLALRKRKFQEQLLSKTDKQLEALEQLTSNVEFALIQKDVLYGLQQGNTVLKQIEKEMSLEKAEKIMGDTEDAIAYQKQLDEVITRNMSNEDQDAVDEEFEKMLREAKAEQRIQQGLPPEEVPAMPNAPNSELVSSPVEQTEEEKEMKAKAKARERRQQLLAA
ncbi:Vacuolar protein sorting-associated protein 20 [Arthrobotrys musiformis]|uniref:Vacuolar protein sorting-associated protein 20 n=2 Tax=Arthrobotrys musiformis TaxID=47236 RepID=A0AAV9WKF2_9PEZI